MQRPTEELSLQCSCEDRRSANKCVSLTKAVAEGQTAATSDLPAFNPIVCERLKKPNLTRTRVSVSAHG